MKMTMSDVLFESGDANVDASGRAKVTLGPLQAFEKWRIKRITIQCTSSTLVPVCRVYRGGETRSRLIDGSHTGTLDHSDTDINLLNGESIVAVWEGREVGTSGADVGSVCTLTIEGESTRG